MGMPWFIEELTIVINDPNITIERLMAFTPAVSSSDSELYKLIETLLAERHPGATVLPGVSTGFTDSHFFRDLGIASYGFGAFVIPAADRRGVHGNDERISVDTLVSGTEVMIELVQRFASGDRGALR